MDLQFNTYLPEFDTKKNYFNTRYSRGRNQNWVDNGYQKEPISIISSGNSYEKKYVGRQTHQNDFTDKIGKPKKNVAYYFRKSYQFIYSFMDTSSIHGFGHLTARRRHTAEYVLWGIFLVAALIGTIYISRQAWIRYQYFPTVISMERDYKNWNTSFPTAAVCPDEKLDESKLRNLAKTRYKVKDEDNFVAFFKQLALLQFEDFEKVMDYKEVSPDEYMRVLTDAAFVYTYEVSNSYDSESGELTPIITEMGLCYTYNSQVALHFTPENFFQKNMNVHIKGKVIYGSPLDGELFSQIMTMNSGYNMTITGPYDIPDTSTKRMNSEPFNYKTVELTALSIISADSIRDLKIFQRRCRYYDESNLEVSDVYTYILCRMQCRLDYAFRLCKCIPFFYRKTKGKPYCDPAGLRCLGKHGQYLSDLRTTKTGKKVTCDCYPLCNDVHFVVEMDNTMAWRIATNLKWGMIRYPRIRLKREIIFGFSDLLVSVGGTAAFFLGCSVLSFVEIVYFFTIRLFIFIIRQCRKL